jgi:serine/threonine protein phosphatase PrpC
VRFSHAVELAAARTTGQDRAAVFEYPDRLVIALADGAGGSGNGALAAEALVAAVRAAGPAADWSAVIEALDLDGLPGETTAVVLAIDAERIAGASVGDSGAWLIGDAILDLTEGQVRKPLVGSGCTCFAVAAGALGEATLLVASDGLLRYANHRDIARIARGPDLTIAARALIDLVRLPAGALQDDVSVVLCRRA